MSNDVGQVPSSERIDAYNAAWPRTIAVRKALKGKSAVIQMAVSDAPGGEIRYWLRIGDGTASAGLHNADNAEVTISQSYETSAKVRGASWTARKRSRGARSKSRFQRLQTRKI